MGIVDKTIKLILFSWSALSVFVIIFIIFYVLANDGGGDDEL